MHLSNDEIERLRSRVNPLLRSDALLGPEDRRDVEEREYPRIEAALACRFIVDGGADIEATLDMVSATGFSLTTMHPVRTGQRVVADVQVIGHLDGVVVRLTDTGFAVENHYSHHKRERLASTVDWLAHQDIESLKVRRRHERVKPRVPSSTVLVDGSPRPMTVSDASRSGAAFSCAMPLAVGTLLTFGVRHPIRARVIRTWEGGCAAEFLRLLPPERVDPEDGF